MSEPLELIENPNEAQLGPGRYYLYFETPDYLLMQARNNPTWTQEVTRRIFERSNANVRVVGAGVVNEREDGELVRYFGVTLDVFSANASVGEDVGTQQVAVGLVAGAVIVSAIAATLIFAPERLAKAYKAVFSKENTNDLTQAIRDAGASLGLFGWAAILFGGAALVYALGRRDD